MQARILQVVLGVALATSVQALGNLELRSQVPVRVHLDGEFVGETPLLLTNIQPGDHQVQAEDPTTGELKTYMFRSPVSATVSKTIEIPVSATPAPAPAPVVYTPAPQPVPVPQQVVYVPRPVPVPRPAPVCRPVPSYRTPAPRTVVYPTSTHKDSVQKAKVHTRNALLALTAATQVFTGNAKDRQHQRNLGLGLMALNEILR